MILETILALALQAPCPSIQPGPDWICFNGGWLHPSMIPAIPTLPGDPVPRPQPPRPPGSINDIAIVGIDGVVEDPRWKPGAIRALEFRLMVPAGHERNNCDGALTASWFAPIDLHIVEWDAWLGAMHVGPAADIRTTAVVSYPGTTVYEQPTYRWSLERYDTKTNYNHPDRSPAPPGTFWFIEKGGRLTVEFFCSAIPDRLTDPPPPIGYLASFLVKFTVPPPAAPEVPPARKP